jgi:4-hydroxybenzoate polyprenyltransferase
MNENQHILRMLPRALRVHQWPKNLFVFAAVIFAQQLGITSQVLRSLGAFAAFCAASSAVYLFNDIIDLERDRAHPEKRNRPLASGALSVRAAIGMLSALAVGALVAAGMLGAGFVCVILFYFALTVFYTLLLRNLVIVDVLVVAMCFVVRALGGAVALHVTFSNWLVVCTLFLALFLGLSKRRHEIGLLREDRAAHRTVLVQYSIAYLDHLIVIVAAATIITYTIYTCSPDVVQRLGTDKLYLTLPFVLYGLFRYFLLVHFQDGGGDPALTLARDWPLVLTVVLYGATCVGIIYGHKLI